MLVRGGGWDRPKASYKPSDYVLLKQNTKYTLDTPHSMSEGGQGLGGGYARR